MDINRRNFAKSAASLLYLPTTVVSGQEDIPPTITDPYWGMDAVFRHVVPVDLQPLDLTSVEKSLKSYRTLAPEIYIPQLVNLIQYVHHQITGMTYPEHMKKRYGTKSPLEVLAVRDVIVNEGMEEIKVEPTTLGGKFTGGRDSERNIAYVDALVRPKSVFDTLAHEFTHAAYGNRELTAYLNGIMEVAFAIGKFPQFLSQNNSTCLLVNLLENSCGIVYNTRGRLDFYPPGGDRGASIAIFGMEPKKKKEKVLSLDEAVSAAINDENEALAKKLKDTAIKWTKNNDYSSWYNARNRLIDAVEQYILKVNPDMPKDKIAILRKSVDHVKKVKPFTDIVTKRI